MSKKILIIEDEIEMVDLIKYALSPGNFDVVDYGSGFHAWDEILKVKPDLVILDVMLPGVDGYSLQLKLSENAKTKAMPTIILTAIESSKSLFEKFPQIASFISKPFKAEQLLNAAQEALAKSTHTWEARA
jgi:two-component system alkaline phosphatase synthesis response regulator PhoP